MARAWEPNFVRVQPSRYGPVSSVGWEAGREGIEDYRYLRQIEKICREAPGAVADEARRWLTSLRERVVETAIDRTPEHPWDKNDLWTECPQFEPAEFPRIHEEAIQFLMDLKNPYNGPRA